MKDLLERIKDLETINETHQQLNGELRSELQLKVKTCAKLIARLCDRGINRQAEKKIMRVKDYKNFLRSSLLVPMQLRTLCCLL